MAGLTRKDNDFWRKLKEWDVVVLIETWIEEKGWGKMKDRMPEGYIWGVQMAKKEHRRGRARGGLIMGIKKEIWERDTKIETEKEGFIVGRVRLGEEGWRVVGIYAREGGER